jgi:CTP:molybdopterin cytidylyltransferase MocA/xanthine/CO dehydrogenase XdhC/CoxF family maturation factor
MRRTTLEQLAAAGREGRPMVRAVDPESGEERLIDPAADNSALGRAAAGALARDASGRAMVEGRAWFLTLYNVPRELVIVGAVHIAQALASLAVAAGYRVRVIDPRPAYAADERFAGIRLVREWPDEALAAEPLGRRSALVALAHDPKIDDPALMAGSRSPAFYIGALGSRRTHERRLARLKGKGLGDDTLARIRGPVGLAIGARSPAEIAIAILAEMVQVIRAPKTSLRIGGVVLAAGLSGRMGSNKLVTEVNGKPLVRHAAEAALAGGLDPVVVVTGHQAERIAQALEGLPVRLTHNPAFAEGLSTSLKVGIASLPPDCAGAAVLLGDMPDVTPPLVRRVAAAFHEADGNSIVVATSQGRPGHPVLWGRGFFAELMRLAGDQGGREVLAANRDHVVEVEAGDDAPVTDIDTQEALASYLAGSTRPRRSV